MSIMTVHPVRFRVEPPARLERVHVVIRLALFLALAAIGRSPLCWLLYVALPALVALVVSQKGPERYLAEDAPRIVRVLRWFAGAYAYLWLLTDAIPTTRAEGPVELEVETGGAPNPASALLRLLYSLPALVLLAVLSIAAGFLWLVGAVVILVRRRVPAVVADFLALTLRYQFRLAAYHLSLVDRYPSFEEVSVAPASHTAA